jgi:hypothetical protein
MAGDDIGVSSDRCSDGTHTEYRAVQSRHFYNLVDAEEVVMDLMAIEAVAFGVWVVGLLWSVIVEAIQ